MSATEQQSRQLGLLVFIVLTIAWFFKEDSSSISYFGLSPLLGIAFAVGLITILAPRALNPVTKLWMKVGDVLGFVIRPVVLGFIYFFVVTPISLIMKLLRKDILELKTNKESFWVKRETPSQPNSATMKQQF